jgi:DNA-binding MarR family transcriptional regulator
MLTRDQAESIRVIYARGESSMRAIGLMFGVTPVAVHKIVHGLTHK